MTQSSRFPHPNEASPEGIVAWGGDLSPDMLIDAYTHGIFPWPVNETTPLLWFSPDPRAILRFSNLHMPRSLKKFLKACSWKVTQNQAFSRVIHACRNLRLEKGTWITEKMATAYERLHQDGIAHSIEVWAEGGELVGGVYGILLNGVFSAESMFHTEPNASKVALLGLVDHLTSKGLTWIDIQVMTPHLKVLGAEDLPRNQFLDLLRECQRK